MVSTIAVKQGYEKMRATIIQLLGGKCIRCGYKGPALQVDHIHGGGRKERKICNGTWALYRHILRQIQLGSKDYQLLCANCNWEKRFENKECIKI